jgi:hypothetical protein
VLDVTVCIGAANSALACAGGIAAHPVVANASAPPTDAGADAGVDATGDVESAAAPDPAEPAWLELAAGADTDAATAPCPADDDEQPDTTATTNAATAAETGTIRTDMINDSPGGDGSR